jgi:hypothetical protein
MGRRCQAGVVRRDAHPRADPRAFRRRAAHRAVFLMHAHDHRVAERAS